MQVDYVQVVYRKYSSVIDKGYGDELELQYFTEKMDRSHGRYWVLERNNNDSRPLSELQKVEP